MARKRRIFPGIDELAALPASRRARLFRDVSPEAFRGFAEDWSWRAFRGQCEPPGTWRVWLLMAGRGFGKTRAGAEWVLARVRERPDARIALVGGNLGEVERVMVTGPSGILRSAPFDERPVWRPSDRTLAFPSGALAFAYSAERPESLRGPEHHFAWCDELAKWPRGDSAWDNLMLGLRCGERPRSLVTTTPRPVPLIRRIRAMAGVETSGGRTLDNVALALPAVAALVDAYGGTRLGRQELGGELIDDVEGALWTRELIESSRSGTSTGEMRRVVIGVDPPASAEGDACGIVACGLGGDGIGYVLGDHSVRGLSPEGWARRVAEAAEHWGADKVVVEANQGGEMVESVLRGADVALPVRSVHARYGKSRRAEPVATWFEKGKAKFAGAFPELEDELAGLTVGGGYEGPGRSPDRADAMVWAMTELLGAKERPMPRVRRL